MTKIQTASQSFILTKEYRRFTEFCDACRRHQYIGLCYGPPGVGKTLSARHYTRWDQLEPYLKDPIGQTIPEEFEVCRAALYTPKVENSPKRLEQEIYEVGVIWDGLPTEPKRLDWERRSCSKNMKNESIPIVLSTCLS